MPDMPTSPLHSILPRRKAILGLAGGLCALLAPPAWAAGAALPPLPRFTAPVLADSPLAGRILAADRHVLAPSQLVDACAHATLCLLGEQHDHPDHHALQAWMISALAGRHRLAAVALEMADAGRRFDGPADAPEAAVRAALDWDDKGWPWALYAAPVMAAVRAGVPVVGVNLPRAQVRPAMREARWDATIPADARSRIIAAVVDSHCGLLPAAQAPAMARVQIARDASMARGSLALARPGRTVVLLTGGVHADRTLGVPLHVPRQTRLFSLLLRGLNAHDPDEPPPGYDAVWFTPGTPPVDHCAELRTRLRLP